MNQSFWIKNLFKDAALSKPLKFDSVFKKIEKNHLINNNGVGKEAPAYSGFAKYNKYYATIPFILAFLSTDIWAKLILVLSQNVLAGGNLLPIGSGPVGGGGGGVGVGACFFFYRKK